MGVSMGVVVGDLEKGGEKDVGENVNSEDVAATKIPVVDFPDGGFTAWLMVFGARWISFSTFGAVPLVARSP